jgi:Yip1 domain
MATNMNVQVPAPMNPFQRLMGMYFSPKATLEDIVARPSWIIPVILLCICSLAVTFTFTQRVGWHAFIEKKFEQNPNTQQMTPEAREKAIDTQAKYAPIFGYVVGAGGVFVAVLLLAAVGLGAFNLTGGGQLKFRTCMALVAWAWVPFLLAYLLAILVILLKPPDTVDLENLVASNPGAFLSSDAPKWLASLLGSLDLFSIWALLLLGLGFSTTNPRKISFGKSLTVWVVLWILYIAVKVGLTAAFA